MYPWVFAFHRSVYSDAKNGRKRWYEKLREQRAGDVTTEII
jgi:hypothetical protein